VTARSSAREHVPLANWRSGKPKVIVLATDWSARGDRPLDRAIQLANYWGAWLAVLTVVEEPVPDDEWEHLEAQIKARLFEEMPSRDVRFHIDVARGDVAEKVIEVAYDKRADLVVTGVAHRDHLGEFVLGTTVDELVATTSTPLLVVKSRPHNGYAHILATTDYTEGSAYALDVLPAFPRAEVTLAHAYRPAISAILAGDASNAPVPQSEISAREAFLAAIHPELRKRVNVASIGGLPWEALASVVREKRLDLALVERHGRSWVGRALIGGMAQKLLGALPCDVLVIPEPG
jgi:nucleotide-binding universal stress UspA family protein